MKHIINYIFSILTITSLFALVTTINSPPSMLSSQNMVYASTQQQQEEEEEEKEKDEPEDSSSENNEDSSGDNEDSGESENSVGSEQSNGEDVAIESFDSLDQNQVQQPQQIDTISPEVLSVNPNYGTSGIPVTTTITATFSEPVEASTVNSNSFLLKEGSNDIQGSVSLTSDGTTALFTPSSSLSGSTVYTASISKVKDLSGNTMNYASPWSFTTEPQSSPPQPPPQQQPPPENSDRVKTAPPIDTDILTQQPPPQQPSPSNPSTPSNPGGGGSGNSGGSGGGGVLGDIKTSPTEKDVLKDAAQYVEDEKLVDRILPIILSKMDKRQLATTVLPYLDLQVTARQVDGGSTSAEGSETKAIKVVASCSPEEILIGGSFGAGPAGKVQGTAIEGNQWSVWAEHSPHHSPTGFDQSTTSSHAICLTAKLVPKDPNAPTLTNGGQ